MAKPKLALIPATQGSKLYSVLPADGVGDFNFSRNSAATRINKDGLIETVAVGKSRLNYPLIDGVVNGCPSHLLEPSRLQLIQYSEDFSQSYWAKIGVLAPVSGFISPDGTTNAFKLVEDTSNSDHNIHSTSVSVSNSTVHTIHHYVKSGENNIVGLQDVYNSQYWATINLKNGTILDEKTSGDTKVVLMSNGFYKISIKFTSNQSIVRASIFLLPNSYANGRPSDKDYTGDGTSGVYIYGAQLEQGSYATSYIPNYGTSAGITRVAETANGAGDASTFNDSEGVLMAEISALANDGLKRSISINDGSSANRFILRFGITDNTIEVVSVSNNAAVLLSSVTVSNTLISSKVAVKWDSNNYVLYVNGIIETSINNLIKPLVLNNLDFNDGNSGFNPFYGNTKQIQYFDSALNDSDLETITSWTSFTDLANGQTYSIK